MNFKSLTMHNRSNVLSAGFCKRIKVVPSMVNKDVRHKFAQILADHVETANVGLKIKIFPSKSLFKPKEQYKPLTRGQLDMTVFPLSYAGGQQPAYNLTNAKLNES